jgi:hypothetical protein
MQTLLAIATVATCYTGQYVDQPLAFGGIYTYTAEPWVAMPESQLGVTWLRHDLIYVSWGQGDGLLARARDTGPFGRYHVDQWGISGGLCR